MCGRLPPSRPPPCPGQRHLLIRSIWVRTALTTRMASEGSVPALQALRAAVRLSTCGGGTTGGRGRRLAPRAAGSRTDQAEGCV